MYTYAYIKYYVNNLFYINKDRVRSSWSSVISGLLSLIAAYRSTIYFNRKHIAMFL